MSKQSIHPVTIRLISAFFSVLVLAIIGVDSLQAQNTGTKKAQLPKPIDIPLDTSDGWAIRCTYFPGGVVQKKSNAKENPKTKAVEEFTEKRGKSVIPIILVHGYKGQRSEYETLAKRLQREGHAVMVPDLRGHGDSKNRRFKGKDIEVEANDLKPADFANMHLDLAAAKRFLFKENNAEKLNVEQLIVVGSELGALVAMHWSVYDWTRPSIPAVKVGQDVKALVLLSPDQSFKGLNTTAFFANPAVRQRLFIMIAVGEQESKANSDAKQIYNRFERFHPKPEERSENPDLLFVPLATTLQGTKTLTKGLATQDSISNFIRVTVGRSSDRLEWSKRELTTSTE